MQITPDKLAAYKQARRHRDKLAQQLLLEQRRERAWQLARQVAALIKERYHATKVVVFGSLVQDDLFTQWSDIDIAAYGIAPANTFKAIGDVIGLDDDITIDLIDVNACSSSLLGANEQYGIEL